MGRACCEFWLAKCMEQKIEVSIALRSNLLDANVEIKDKLYGYHRLDDPMIVVQEKNKLIAKKSSKIITNEHQLEPTLIGRNDEHLREPKKW